MEEKGRKIAEKDNLQWNKCIEKVLKDEAPTIMLPKSIHSLGQTYKVKKSAMEGWGDLDKTANQVAQRDVKTYENVLRDEEPINKYGKKLNAKQKKKLKESNAKCKKKIKEGLEKMRKMNHDKFLRDKILENQVCN